jgi:hypothetical protein
VNTGNVVQFSARDPFAEAQEPIRSCWNLGYRDGVNDVDTQIGEEGLEALAVSTRANLAGLNGELEACKLRAEELAAKTAAANSLLLPRAGRQKIGVAAWIVAAFYIGLAVLAFGADLPLSGLTMAEALGRGTNLTSAEMLYLQTAAVWSLGLTLCLIGFCLKIMVDVLDHARAHHWWETILVAAACVLCGLSIYGVSKLRDSMGRQQIAFQELNAASSTVPIDRGRVALAVTTAMKAANTMAGWTAFTLMWVTVTLPVLSAVSAIVAFRQIRVYRGHNRALSEISLLSSELPEQAERRVRLQFAITEEEERLKQAESGRHTSEVKERAIAAYRHGFATGEAARLAPLTNRGTYGTMLAKLNRRRA